VPDKTIYVGKKPVMAYVTACITCLNDNYLQGGSEVMVAARGNSISRVVDVIEVLKRFVRYEVKGVEFGTDKIDQDGGTRNISTIRVTLRKF